MIILDESIDQRFNTKLLNKEVLEGPLLSCDGTNIIFLDTKEAVDYMWFCYFQNHTQLGFTDSWSYSESVLNSFLIDTSNNTGKLDVQSILLASEKYGKPDLVYINNTLPNGIYYCIDEIKTLYFYCKTNGIILYINGDRLPNAICEWQVEDDNWLSSIINHCDLLSIGGERFGAMFGVPCISSNPILFKKIKKICHQNGLISLASNLISRHYEYLIKSGSYVNAGKISNQYAQELELRLKAIGMQVFRNTNHLFTYLNDDQIIEISKHVKFKTHKKRENTILVEFVFDYLVEPSSIDEIVKGLYAYYKK